MYLYGAGGHAKVIIESLESMGVRVDGVVDDNPQLAEVLGYPVYHVMREEFSPMIVSIGNNEIRRRIATGLAVEFATVVHPAAVVSPRAVIGEGTVIMPNAVVNVDTHVGRHCIVNTAASVDHDCRLGDFVHVSPNVALCGGVTVGEGTQIGVGACVTPGVRIGRWSLICAGSVVTRDIPDFCVASGDRCKPIRYNNMIQRDLTNVKGGGVKRSLSVARCCLTDATLALAS